LVEQLNHDCYFVQIPRLKIDLKNRVSKMLLIFNQKFIVDSNKQVLLMPDEFMQDAELMKFITRLSKPLLSERLLRDADAEEVMEEAFEKLETKIERIEGKLEKQAMELERKDKELEELKRKLENFQNKN
jgi:septal ring factor EnvC (AmiA/AmiB activator)